MGAALYAHHARLGVSCGDGCVGNLIHSMVQWWCSRHRLVVAVNIRVMARYTGMAESLGEGASANSIEGTCWHITKRVDMTVIVDANGIE